MRIGLFTDTYYPQINGVATSVLTLKEQLEVLGHQVSSGTAAAILKTGLSSRFPSLKQLICIGIQHVFA